MGYWYILSSGNPYDSGSIVEFNFCIGAKSRVVVEDAARGGSSSGRGQTTGAERYGESAHCEGYCEGDVEVEACDSRRYTPYVDKG